MARVLNFPHEFLVWCDETGCDQMRKFGYSLRGRTPVYHRYLVRGTRISSVLAMTLTDYMRDALRRMREHVVKRERRLEDTAVERPL